MTTIASTVRSSSISSDSGRSDAAPAGKKAIWAGRVLSGLAVLFLAFDATFKLVASEDAASASSQLGWSASKIVVLGVLELLCLAAYLVPRTALVGAVLWTGYLGGAVATHLRIDDPLFSHTLFPIYVAALLWGGLWLRDRRTRALIAG